jgi:hypothetical protein
MSVLTVSRLEHRGLGVFADVLGHLETPERAASLRMRLTFGYPLPIEVRHLLDEIVILQQYWAVGPNGERELIAGDWNPSVGCCGFVSVVLHDSASVVTRVVSDRCRVWSRTLSAKQIREL